MTRRSEPAAVLWDFDGTLVDTEPSWIEAEYALTESFGAAWSREQALQLVGNDLLESGRVIREQTGIPLTPEEIVERLVDEVTSRVQAQVPWRAGAQELLARLRVSQVPCGLVTMSYRRFVEPALAALPTGTFGSVVTGDAVDRGKPHPEAYLTAAAQLGVEPAACVAVEDSDTGATAAEEAGCAVLVVPNHVAVPARPGRAFVRSLREVDPDLLGRLTAAVAGRPIG